MPQSKHRRKHRRRLKAYAGRQPLPPGHVRGRVREWWPHIGWRGYVIGYFVGAIIVVGGRKRAYT